MESLTTGTSKSKQETYQVINKETGTIYRELSVEKKEYITGEHYWRISKKVFELLCGFDYASSKVLAVVIENVKPMSNIMNYSMRKLATEAGCDERIVDKTLALMQEKDIITITRKPEKRKNGELMLNPRFFAKASQLKHQILEGQYDEHKGKPISPYGLVSAETGEIFPLPLEVTQEKVNYQDKEHFYKAFKLFTKALSGMSGAELKLFSFVLQNLDWTRNDIHFTMADYARCYKTSTPAVSRMMQELRKRDIIVSLGLGRWMVNPTIIMQGYEKRFYVLKTRYEKAKKEAEEAAEQRKTEKKKKAAEAVAVQSQQPVSAPEVSAPEPPMSQKIPIPGGGLWPPQKEEKPQQNKIVPFIPAAMQAEMAAEKRKREEEMYQESIESIDISTVPYDDGESDEHVPLEYVEAGAATWDDDDDDATYIKDDDDLPF